MAAIGFAVLLTSYSASAGPEQQLADFQGHWKNIKRFPEGVSKMDIQATNGPVTIEAFGACTPTDCDWGVSPALAYAPKVTSDLTLKANSLTTEYDFGFAESRIVIYRLGRRALRVDTFTHFKDGSGRTDFHSVEYMRRLHANETF
ncbi:MAG: hypothetical protein C5B50_06120 [Verrucomicrobia bacterium]|nr:MAG: hypothetical protein C5B50_06120 [Verrucomicrobiota bacterium]